MIKSYSKYKSSYKLKKKKSFFQYKIFWIFFVSVLIFSGAFYFFIFSSFFQVQSIEILGLEKIQKEEFKNIIEKNIQKNILMIPSRNIFLTDFVKIKKEVFNSFPQLDAIKIKRKFPVEIIIIIEEKKPIAVLILQGKQFFIDKKGIIFEEIGDGQTELPKIIIDGLNESLKIGQEIIDKNRLSKIIDINYRLKSELGTQIDVFKITAPDKLVVKTKDAWEFYLNIEGDTDWQLTKLGVVLEQKIPPEKRQDLEYVELRFGNFAPYKYK